MSNQFTKITKHGHSPRKGPTKVYRCWRNMIARCNNEKATDYHRYGGRGISVCQRWLIFANFLIDMGEPPSEFHSIDRINNDGNYEPGNCRWATESQQKRNTSRNVILTIDGTSLTIVDWSKFSGIKKSTIIMRLLAGWGHRKAVFDPPDFGRKGQRKPRKNTERKMS